MLADLVQVMTADPGNGMVVVGGLLLLVIINSQQPSENSE